MGAPNDLQEVKEQQNIVKVTMQLIKDPLMRANKIILVRFLHGNVSLIRNKTEML